MLDLSFFCAEMACMTFRKYLTRTKRVMEEIGIFVDYYLFLTLLGTTVLRQYAGHLI